MGQTVMLNNGRGLGEPPPRRLGHTHPSDEEELIAAERLLLLVWGFRSGHTMPLWGMGE